MDFELNGVVSVDELTILGVTFDARCGWSSHFDKVVKNASRRLYALRLLRSTLNKKQLIIVYNSLLRSILEYCGPLFLGMSEKDRHRLDGLQKRFHRLLCGRSCKEDCLESLNDRRCNTSLKFLEKIKEDHVLNEILPQISKTGRFILPNRRTERRSRSYIPIACELSNTTRFNR